MLGVSNASGMFDITGTMWLVYITFVYGLKGAFIPKVLHDFQDNKVHKVKVIMG